MTTFLPSWLVNTPEVRDRKGTEGLILCHCAINTSPCVYAPVSKKSEHADKKENLGSPPRPDRGSWSKKWVSNVECTEQLRDPSTVKYRRMRITIHTPRKVGNVKAWQLEQEMGVQC
ncbi:hypothetical protein J6590_039288 [Homalodisca vitripennis]|nr:hypothetical protein J6590_039288 [Homalodisca vitripennis]